MKTIDVDKAKAFCGGIIARMMAGVPPAWVPSVHVADPTHSTETALVPGASRPTGPKEVPGIGSLVILCEPKWADLGVWQETTG